MRSLKKTKKLILNLLYILLPLVVNIHAQPEFKWFKEAADVSGLKAPDDTGTVSCLRRDSLSMTCISQYFVKGNSCFKIISKGNNEKQQLLLNIQPFEKAIEDYIPFMRKPPNLFSAISNQNTHYNFVISYLNIVDTKTTEVTMCLLTILRSDNDSITQINDTLGVWDVDYKNGSDTEVRSYLRYARLHKETPAINQHGFVMINKNRDGILDISTLHYRNEYTRVGAEKKIISSGYHLEKTGSGLSLQKIEDVNTDSFLAEKIIKSKITVLF